MGLRIYLNSITNNRIFNNIIRYNNTSMVFLCKITFQKGLQRVSMGLSVWRETNQGSKFCQSDVKQSQFQNLTKKRK